MPVTFNRNLTSLAMLRDENMNEKVIGMWSSRTIGGEFYKTGFETLLFNQSSCFALETVLQSVVTWDKELLVAGTGNSLTILEKRLSKYKFSTYYCNLSDNDWNGISSSLQNLPGITHLLVNISCPIAITNNEINRLLSLINDHKVTLIINCEAEVVGLNDLFMNAIDFMIGKYDTGQPGSFVVARRSKLVQTEGNSKCFSLDLYSYWQLSLSGRDAVIEPMCG